MKLYKLYSQLLNEDFKSQTVNFIRQGFEPDIVKSYIDKFKHIRDNKYKEIFDENLKVSVPSKERLNIDAYKNFHDLEVVVDYVSGKRAVNTNMTKGGKENIEVDGTPIYDDKNYEVYYADTPRACIKYKGKFPYSWCVARSDSANMFYTYRFKPYEPAFYFIKNKKETDKEFSLWNMGKNVFQGKFSNPYHFFVIQVPKNANIDDNKTQQYIVTSANNDGDKQMSWDEIIAINPNLNSIKEVLVPKPLSEGERKKIERFKNGINDKEFAKLTYEEKRDYLDIYPTIGRPITSKQLKELPDDLLNLYVSFGIGLDDEGFEFIKPKKDILKRYAQISKRKLEEYLKTDNYQRKQLKMMYSELIVLSDEDIKSYLESLKPYEIKQFIRLNGEDKFELLEKHLPDKFGAQFQSNKQLILMAQSGDEEALNKLASLIPEDIEFDFYGKYIVFEFDNTDSEKLKRELDNDTLDFYSRLDYNEWNSSYNNDYYFDDESSLNDTYDFHIESVLKDDETLRDDLLRIGIQPDLESVKDLLVTYKKDSSIKEYMEEKYSEGRDNAQEKTWEKLRDGIKSIAYIDDYRNYSVYINVASFVFYLNDNEFLTSDIDNFITKMAYLLENIMEDNDQISYVESMYDEVNEGGYDFTVGNEVNERVKSEIQDAIYEFTSQDDEDETDYANNLDSSKIHKLKGEVIKLLNDTLRNLGQSETASTIENDIVRIDIDRQRFHLDGKVFVSITDKQNNKKHDGYVYIKDLPTYFKNYKLFETIQRIKSIIKY